MSGGVRAPLAAVLALELFMFVPGLVQEGIYLRPPPNSAHEGVSQFLIFRQYWREQVQAGRLPLWNPYLLGGYSFIGDPQAATLSPTTFLLLLPLSHDTIFKLTAMLHVFLGTIGMYLLGRALGANRWGAALGAYAFGFSAQFVVFVFGGWVPLMSVAAWAPLVLWAFVRANESSAQRGRFIGAAGVCLGLQLVAGHLEWAYFTLIVLAALSVAFAARRGQSPRMRPLAIAAAIVALGGLVASPQLVPAIEAAFHSARGRGALSGYPASAGLGFPAAFLPSLVAPKLFGPWDVSLSVDSWLHKLVSPRISFGESVLYSGILPLLLASAGAGFRGSPLTPRFWIGMFVAALALAMNDLTHLRSAIGWAVPAVEIFRAPTRFVFLASIALSVLAALGASRVADGSAAPATRAIKGAIVAAVALAVAGACLVAFAHPLADAAVARMPVPPHLAQIPALGEIGAARFAEAASRWGGQQLIWAAALIGGSVLALRVARRLRSPGQRFAVLLAVVAADLMVFAWPFLTSVHEPARYYRQDLRQLAAIGPPRDIFRIAFDDDGVLWSGRNAPMLARIRSAGGYEVFRLDAYERFFRTAERDPDAYLPVFGVTHRVRTRVSGRGRSDAPWEVTRVADPLPRAYLTSRAIAASVDAALPRLPELLRQTPPTVFVHACPADLGGAQPPGQDRPPVVDVDEPGRVVVSIAAQGERWLVLNEMYYPGWRAWVDGVASPVCHVNAVMRGVRVPAGSHRVEFRYRPSWWMAAWIASGGALALSVALMIRRGRA